MVEHDSDFGFSHPTPRLTFRFEGGLDFSRIDELDRTLSPPSSLDGVEIIVDLTCVTFVDSTVIRWLLSTQENVRRRNGRLRLVTSPSGGLVKVLALTGLQGQIKVDLMPASVSRSLSL